MIFIDEKSFAKARALLQTLLINLDFESKYVIQDNRLGKGASANVYKIYDAKMDRYFAGKFISKEYLKKTPKRVISVINEMDVLRKLDHPNIVKLYEVHEIESYIILVLELLEGESMGPDLFTNPREGEINQVFSQVISGLKYLNDNGLMHRDIKPSNLRFVKMYNKNQPGSNVIKLIDFGFIEYYGSQKYTRYYCGTVGYMCPFIMNNSKQNPKNYGPEVD